MKSLHFIGFAIVFSFITLIFQGCSFYNLDERPDWAFHNEQGDTIRDTKYPPEFYLTFLGEGRAITVQEARKLAERNALKQLSETILSRIKSETNIETSMIKKAGIYTQEVKLNEVIYVKSESDIPNFMIEEVWDIGIDHDRQSVVYVLGVFDIVKATASVSEKCKNILLNVKNQWNKINKLYSEKKLGELPLLLNQMVENFEQARYSFPVYYFLGGQIAYEEVREISSIKLDFDALISTSLSRLTYTTDDELNFVRGKSNNLKLQVCVPHLSERIPLKSTKFNVKTETYAKVITSDEQGFLSIPMSTNHKLRSGNKTLKVELWLQNENTKPSAEISKIENKCKFTVSYTLTPDYVQAQKHFTNGEDNIKKKAWATAINEFESSKVYIWDIADWIKVPTTKIHFCNYNISWDNAQTCMGNKEYESALRYFETCKSEAKSGKYEDEYANADENWRNAVYLNAVEQIKTGNDVSRDFALSRLFMVPGSFRRSEIPQLIKDMKKKLPCPVCRFSGKCPDCEGTGKILRTCRTCTGQGIVKERCKVCKGTGKEDCPVCNGEDHTWVRCKNCNGSGKLKCPKCSGNGAFRERCTKCDGRGEIVFELNGRQNTRKCLDCKGKGVIIRECSECRGKGTIKCPICNKGYGSKPGYEKKDCPNCTDGKIPCRNRECKNGWLVDTCPECNGQKQIYYPCSDCNGTGICPHCHGIAHRP